MIDRRAFLSRLLVGAAALPIVVKAAIVAKEAAPPLFPYGGPRVWVNHNAQFDRYHLSKSPYAGELQWCYIRDNDDFMRDLSSYGYAFRHEPGKTRA